MTTKLLVFINYFGKTSETFISDELEFLSKQPTVELSVLHYGSSIPAKNVIGLNMPSFIKERWLKAPLNLNLPVIKSLKFRNGLNASLPYLINFFKENKFDTIYCHFGTNGKLIAQLKQLGVIPKETKLIVRFHGLEMNFSKYPIGFYDILNRQSYAVLAGSNYARRNLIKFGVDMNLIFLRPVGVKCKSPNKSELRKKNSVSGFNIISVGRLVDMKGFLDGVEIINNLSLVSEMVFHYTIVGDGPLLSQIQSKIDLYNLNDKITVINSLPHAEVLNLLNKSDIYLYSGILNIGGRAETQGLANIEAMSAGLVIVASDVGGVPDYVIDQETGLLVESGNIEKFAVQLDWVMKNYDSNKVREIRNNAVRRVRDNYNQEILNDKLLTVIL